jgi:hypothetical protein
MSARSNTFDHYAGPFSNISKKEKTTFRSGKRPERKDFPCAFNPYFVPSYWSRRLTSMSSLIPLRTAPIAMEGGIINEYDALPEQVLCSMKWLTHFLLESFDRL